MKRYIVGIYTSLIIFQLNCYSMLTAVQVPRHLNTPGKYSFTAASRVVPSSNNIRSSVSCLSKKRAETRAICPVIPRGDGAVVAVTASQSELPATEDSALNDTCLMPWDGSSKRNASRAGAPMPRT